MEEIIKKINDEINDLDETTLRFILDFVVAIKKEWSDSSQT